LLSLLGCSPSAPPPPHRPSRARQRAHPHRTALFTDVVQQAGIAFRHDNGERGQFYFVETTGSGCALFDYDNDGWLDLLLLQAGPVPGTAQRAPWDRQKQPRNRLYRNRGDGTFADVTEGSGLENTGYSQGVAVGDYDNDGYDDLYITAYGGNTLFHNEKGTGKFKDVTQTAGVRDTERGARWATSAAFGDYDRDGFLDLYVCHYALWSPAANKKCHNVAGKQDYCSPEVYDPDVDVLYRNNRNGTFTNVTQIAGISQQRGRGLGVAWLDFNGDGWEDLYVANDLNPNILWRNNRNGTFTNVAVTAGCAYSDLGTPLSGMGIGVSDYDNDGREDLFVTNFSGQPNSLYHNDGNERFTDVSYRSGLAEPHLRFLAFGCEFFDYDADGWRDVIVANGHVLTRIAETVEGVTYKERKQLFRNTGKGTFEEVTRHLGGLHRPTVSRGLAVGDYDNDGWLDVLVLNQNDAPQLLRNNGHDNQWIAFKLVGVKSNRSGAHAKVAVRYGGRQQFSEVRSGSSFCSHSDRRVYFGLGKATQVDEVTIRWLSGTQDTLRHLKANCLYIVTEGQGARP
jgi:hypothetical protein